MLVYPNAKINIGLRILERLENGYHKIESVFYPIGLCDILEVNLAKEDNFKLTGLVPTDILPQDNLVCKALSLFRKESAATNRFQMHLHKCIPSGAGLGGGSADAAFALKAFNQLSEYPISTDELTELASQLGSDVPFFLKSEPAYLLGMGAELVDYELSLKGHWLVVLKPDTSVSTAWAYENCFPRPGEEIAALLENDPEHWRELICNDFETVVFSEHPEVKECKEVLYSGGAIYASMSGSGSAVYGLFDDESKLNSIISDKIIWKEKLK